MATSQTDLPDVGKIAIIPISILKTARKKAPSLKGKTLKIISLPKSKTLKQTSADVTQLGLTYEGKKYPIRLELGSNVQDLKVAVLGIQDIVKKVKSRPFDILEDLGDETYAVIDDSTKISNLLKQDLWIRLRTPKLQLPSEDIDVIQEDSIPIDVQKLTGMQSVFESPKKLKMDEDLKVDPQQSTMTSPTTTAPKRLNEEFIGLMEEFSSLMTKKGEPMRAMAYQKAAERLMLFPDDIISIDQIKKAPTELKAGLGKTIIGKLEEYMKTGAIAALERERADPLITLTQVYGIGPAKAKELIALGITTIDQLKAYPDKTQKLNGKQLEGLKYYDDILKRIPRAEIEHYKAVLTPIFDAATPAGSRFEIVGSYRREAETSGDIDIIITNENNDKNAFADFLKKLKSDDLIKVFLTEGKTKSLTVMQLPGEGVRRVDFMYTPPKDYAFAVLYFTGSKYFNVAMREQALKKGYTLSEHGLYTQVGKIKGDRVENEFPDEKSIFKFLGIKYKEPKDRKGVRSIELVGVLSEPESDTGAPAETTKLNIAVLPADVPAPAPVKRRKAPKLNVGALSAIPELPKSSPVSQAAPSKKRTLKRKPSPTAESLIKDFQTKGISVLKMQTDTALASMLTAADDAYHGNQKPLMTDSEYDILKDHLTDRSPTNSAVTSVGTTVKKNKVTLPYEMPSMDKIKPDTGALEKWRQTYSGPYVISGKADGVSGLYSTENGERKLYTRGNGKEGGDISHMIPFLNLPDTPDITIRGEFMVPKEVFRLKYSDKYSNPRNFIAGVINREKNIDTKIYKDIHFIAYEVLVPELKPSEQMKYLEEIGVGVILYEKQDKVTNEYLSEELIDWRQSYKYEIDGIIVTDDRVYPRGSGNPEHAFAFKMVLSEQVAEAKVVDVLWAPSCHGYLKPRIQIEPVVLGGTTITYATAFNGEFVESNKLGIGAIVQLVRSGDVIPHIMAVVAPATQAKMPDIPYKWNETHVDVMVLDPKANEAVQLQCIIQFFKDLKIDHLGEGNARRIVEAGFNTIPKVLHMTKDDFLTVEGFKEKSATKVFESIRAKVTEASLTQIIGASRIFGRGIGKKRVQPILDAYPDILTSTASADEKIKQVENVSGMAAKTAAAFVEHIPEMLEFLEETGLMDKLVLPKKKEYDTSDPLYDKNIAMTGSRDKVIVEYLTEIGANIVSSINKKTNLLIKKDDHYTSSSVESAEKIGIPVVTVDNFKKTFMKQ